jgi:hypothetical protein
MQRKKREGRGRSRYKRERREKEGARDLLYRFITDVSTTLEIQREIEAFDEYTFFLKILRPLPPHHLPRVIEKDIRLLKKAYRDHEVVYGRGIFFKPVSLFFKKRVF